MSGVLSELKVLDLTRVVAGPYCTMLLADLGADVVKVEMPGTGDETRGWGPLYAGDQSSTFLAVNRNRRSMTLNLKSSAGRKVLIRLVEWADVLVENFRPGTMAGLGFDYDKAKEINPGLIYCSISAFGQTGPYATQGGYDTIAQAAGGIMSATGYPEQPPVKVGVPVADISSAAYSAFGILTALAARRKTGEGQHVDIGLMDSAVALSATRFTAYLQGGGLPVPSGSSDPSLAPDGVFRTRDGYIALSAGDDGSWKRLCVALSMEQWAANPRFSTCRDRVVRRAEIQTMLEDMFAREKTAHWVATLRHADIICGKVNNYEDVFEDPHVVARSMLERVVHPLAGEVRMTGVNVKLSKSPGAVNRYPPLLDEHTEEILTEIGYNAEEVDILRPKESC